MAKASASSDATVEVHEGVFYSFPVNYVASITVKDSLLPCDLPTKAMVCREAIYRSLKLANLGDNRVHPPSRVARHMLGEKAVKLIQPSTLLPWVKLTMSQKGIICQSVKSGKVLSRHRIEEISVALAFVAGDDQHQDYVTFTTKKKGRRFLHVFDCSQFSQEVIGTFGQIFGAKRIKRSTESGADTYEDVDDLLPRVQPGDRTGSRNPYEDDRKSLSSLAGADGPGGGGSGKTRAVATNDDDALVFGLDDEPNESSDAPVYESFGGDALYQDSTVDDWSAFEGSYANPSVQQQQTPSGRPGITLQSSDAMHVMNQTFGGNYE